MTRDVRYRVDVIRNGARFKSLRWERGAAPNIIFDSDSAIQASLSGSFLPEEGVDLLKDELKAVLIADGREQSLGIFRVASLRESSRDGGMRLAVECYDRSWMLQATRTEELLHLEAGASYLDSIKKLLLQAGVSRVRAVPSTAKLAADREDWSIGTDYLSIVNQLLQEMGYWPIWFDADGWAHVEPYAPPSAGRIRHRYGPKSMRLKPMADDWEQESDFFDAPNVFICVCSNADRSGVLRAVSENNSLMSAKSIYRRGMRICQVVKVDQIADQAALQTYADRLRDESLLSAKTLQFQTPAEAGHGSGDVIGISLPGIEGIYEETGWRLTMEPGALMDHTAKRTVLG